MIFYSATTRGFYSEGRTDIPADAVEITPSRRDELFAAERAGKEIVPGPDGFPIAASPPPPTTEELIKAQILVLEAQQTPRRIREAVLGEDGGWLAGIEAQIEALRAQLGAL